MEATISADIVNSTSLEVNEIKALRKRLNELFNHFESEIPGFWARIVRGDTIECYVPDYRKALRVAITIKLYVKSAASSFPYSFLLSKYGIRYSIGIGSLKYVSKEDDIIDGPAIYISGRNLDAISNKKDVYSIIDMERDSMGMKWFLDSYVSLLDNLINGYSPKQAQVVFYKLLGYKEQKISELLNVYQSAINSRSSLARWSLLDAAIKDFENLDKELICG
jgi:hypothetical protein